MRGSVPFKSEVVSTEMKKVIDDWEYKGIFNFHKAIKGDWDYANVVTKTDMVIKDWSDICKDCVMQLSKLL